MLATLDDHDPRGIRVSWIQQHVDGLGNYRGWDGQQQGTALREPRVTNSPSHVRFLDPIRGKLVAENSLNSDTIRHFDSQQAVPSGEVLNFDLEVNEDLKKGGGRTLGAVDDATTAGVPPT